MLISHSHKFIYFAPQKTGTTSLHVALEPFNVEVFGGGVHDIFLPKQYQDYYTFCSVRNPYTRAMSAYNFMLDQSEFTFEECFQIGNHHWMRPIHFTFFERKIPEEAVPMRLDAFVKTESLEEDINALPFVDRRISVPMLNQSDRHRMAWGCRAVEFIKWYYAKDFEYFDYSVDWKDLDLKLLV